MLTNQRLDMLDELHKMMTEQHPKGHDGIDYCGCIWACLYRKLQTERLPT